MEEENTFFNSFNHSLTLYSFVDMPYIEITSLLSSGLNLNEKDFKVQILEIDAMNSERDTFMIKKTNDYGTVIRVGEPQDLNAPQNFEDKNKSLLAYDLIDWDFEPVEIIYFPTIKEDLSMEVGANQKMKFKLLVQYKDDVDQILKSSIMKSPIQKSNFITYCAFGPKDLDIKYVESIEAFWHLHDTEGLYFNTIYSF
jgi:hypothetical protein